MPNSFLKNLNKAQCEAVLSGEGPVLIAAGPGSGKTTVITHKLLYLIYERHIPAEQILVITFTKEAAISMQERFFRQQEAFTMQKGIQEMQKGFVSFATFHSYFYQIIKSIKKYSEYQLITQLEKKRLLLPILKQYDKAAISEQQIRSFLMHVSYYKNTGHLSKEVQEKETFFSQLEEYEKAKQTYKRLDFDDMLWLCKKELSENQKLLQYWQKRFSYILIDEFQDINPIQYEIIKMLSLPPYNLFVVGDDDQAIYGFRGSDATIFQRFMTDFPQAKLLPMATNYRCASMIVKASRSLIEKNKTRTVKELVANEKTALKGKIQAYGTIDTKACSEKLIERLKRESLEQLDQEAVLFRTNASMQRFVTSLVTNKIPFVLREKCDSIYEHFIVKDIMDYIQIANGCRERSVYLRVFQKQGLYQVREVLRTETVDVERLKSALSDGFYKDDYGLRKLEALERHLTRLKSMRPKLGITYILHGMGYERYLLQKAGNSTTLPQDWQEVLEWLQEQATDFVDYKEWLEHQRKDAQQLSKVITGSGEKKGVHLLTMHASKGLEFQKVSIMQLNEGIIPQYSKGEVLSKEKEEEERRLFYVGMTRAKEELELYYMTGTKENPSVRSRFLEECFS